MLYLKLVDTFVVGVRFSRASNTQLELLSKTSCKFVEEDTRFSKICVRGIAKNADGKELRKRTKRIALGGSYRKPLAQPRGIPGSK